MAKKRNKTQELQKLMRQVPEGEHIFRTLLDIGSEFWTEDSHRDRAAAIMGAAFIEDALRKAITTHLQPDPDDPTFKYLFELDDAPYSELAGRIRLARAMGIIGKGDFVQLEAIRRVRNAFAHTMGQITFQTSEVASLLDELDVLDDSDSYTVAIETFRLVHTLLSASSLDKGNRLSFAQAVFIFYYRLTNYIPARASALGLESAHLSA